MFFIAIGLVSFVGGYFLRENAVYQPAYRRMERRIHRESEEARDQARKPLTGQILHTVHYCDEQINNISKKIDVNIYYYSDNNRYEEKKQFEVPITQDNIDNNLVFIGQGNQNENWRRGDVVFRFERMNWAQNAKKKILDQLRQCYPNQSETNLINLSENITNNLRTYGTINIPNPNDPQNPIIFNQYEIV